jgi:hypothetical protein
MPPAKRTTTRPRKTREELQQEMKQIELDVTEQREQRAAPTEAQREHEAAVVRQASEVSVDALAQHITGLGLEVSRALSSVSEKLTQEAEKLAAVREAVAIETRHLQELHQLDVAASSLAVLVAEHQEKRAAFAVEVEGKRGEWLEEQAAHARELKDYEESLKKQRTRERDEYEYQKTLERKKDQDTYEQHKLVLERAQKAKQEALDQQWAAREAVLKAAEAELATLRKDAAAFPARLQKELAEQKAHLEQELAAKHEHTIFALQKESEAERRVADIRITQLNQILDRQNSELALLQAKMEASNQKVQDIALKAIEGASGTQALMHVNKIAMEQAKKQAQA